LVFVAMVGGPYNTKRLAGVTAATDGC